MLERPTKKEESLLFDLPPNWKQEWWGMPEFIMGDARPQQKITVNFVCWDDVLEFSKRLGLSITSSTDSIWFPKENLDRPNEWVYDDES